MASTLYKFPKLKPAISYDEALSTLTSAFTLFDGEKLDLAYPIKVPKLGKLTLFATNWAIRGVFEKPKKKVPNFVLPYKTIIKIKKAGGKRVSKANYGIKFKLSSGCKITLQFPMTEGHRGLFIKRIRELMTNPLEFPSQIWTSNPSWVKRLIDTTDLISVENDFCDTYPPFILMPSSATKELLVDCSKYRSRQRVPLCSYVYPVNNAPLLRSSQPLTGFTKSASVHDQEYLSILCNGHKLSIIDCRPKINAIANQFTGGGYESLEHYDNASFVFLDIPNIHRVRECYIEMVSGIFSGSKHSWTSWGELTMQLIDGAVKSLDELKNNRAVLVHCTDGWDRTAQVTALVQILANPFTRTIDGFIELIQKDWIDTGHKFGQRCSHVPHEKFSETSPIFAQFIDAVGQLLYIQPEAFEFNTYFLSAILGHAYSQLYGDFLKTNYNERASIQRPTSLFECLKIPQFLEKIKNTQYAQKGEISTNIPKYYFSPKILGSPVFFSDQLPIVPSPPPFPNFSLSVLEGGNNQEAAKPAPGGNKKEHKESSSSTSSSSSSSEASENEEKPAPPKVDKEDESESSSSTSQKEKEPESKETAKPEEKAKPEETIQPEEKSDDSTSSSSTSQKEKEPESKEAAKPEEVAKPEETIQPEEKSDDSSSSSTSQKEKEPESTEAAKPEEKEPESKEAAKPEEVAKPEETIQPEEKSDDSTSSSSTSQKEKEPESKETAKPEETIQPEEKSDDSSSSSSTSQKEKEPESKEAAKPEETIQPEEKSDDDSSSSTSQKEKEPESKEAAKPEEVAKPEETIQPEEKSDDSSSSSTESSDTEPDEPKEVVDVTPEDRNFKSLRDEKKEETIERDVEVKKDSKSSSSNDDDDDDESSESGDSSSSSSSDSS